MAGSAAPRHAQARRSLYTLRGTRYGLWRQLLVFLGLDRSCDGACEVDPLQAAAAQLRTAAAALRHRNRRRLILEHFKLRRWLFVGAGKLGDDAMLWGQRIVNRSQFEPELRRVGPLVRARPTGRPATQLISTPDPLRDPFLVYAQPLQRVRAGARQASGTGSARASKRLLAQESPAQTHGRSNTSSRASASACRR